LNSYIKTEPTFHNFYPITIERHRIKPKAVLEDESFPTEAIILENSLPHQHAP